jgi:hypothetical protein
MPASDVGVSADSATAIGFLRRSESERRRRRRAGDRARTGDIQLGRLALYQLSYTRVRLA